MVGLWCVLSACSAYETRLLQAGDADGGNTDGGGDRDGSRPNDSGSLDARTQEDAASDGGTDGATDADVADADLITSDNRFGVYAWGFDQSEMPSDVKPLAWSTSLISELGTRVVRVTLSPSDPYGANPAGPFTLASAAADSEYVVLFNDDDFDTYLLTTYSVADETNPWEDGYTVQEAMDERAEIAELATQLLDEHPGKTFILLNWNGDTAVSGYITPFEDSPVWAAYRDWIQARADGVADARADRPDATGRVFSGLEFDLLRHTTTDEPCDGATVHCVITDVAPYVDVDYYSYAAYQSLSFDTADGDIDTRLPEDLDFVLTTVFASRPEIEREHLIVGAFGFPREAWGECRAAKRTRNTLLAASDWGVGYGTYFQIVDDPEPAAPPLNAWTNHGARRADGSTSLIGTTLASFFETDTPTVPDTLCPSVNEDGVTISGGTVADPIYGDSTISVWGSFAESGNVVHVWHPTDGRFTITSGSSAWDESATQIDATLPGLTPDPSVTVFVTADGIDSNLRTFGIVP